MMEVAMKNRNSKRFLIGSWGNKNTCEEPLQLCSPVHDLTPEVGLVNLDAYQDALLRREELLSEISMREKEISEIDNSVKRALGGREKAVCGKFSIFWTNIQTSRLDSAQLRISEPDIYNRLLKTTISRRFQIKRTNMA